MKGLTTATLWNRFTTQVGLPMLTGERVLLDTLRAGATAGLLAVGQLVEATKMCIRDSLSPYLLIALLSSEPVVQQIKARSHTQDIIDSLGNRIYEIVLPIPKDEHRRHHIIQIVEKVIQDRIEARELARQACIAVVQP